MRHIFFIGTCTALCLWACTGPGVSHEPAPAAADPTLAPIQILASAAERADIRVAAVKREHLARAIHAPAEIVLDPNRTAHLSPLVEARIEKVVVQLGDRVQPGTLLAVLRSVAVGESRAGLVQAQADLALANANLARQTELRAAKIGAQRAYEEAVAESQRAEASAGAARERSRVVGAYEMRAPIAGSVLERHATVGETVAPGSSLFTIAELGQVWVMGQVYERDIGAVALNAASTLTLEAYPGRSWGGPISYVAGTVEHETRTLPVRLVLDNPDAALRPGLFGSLSIEANDALDVLAVPSVAVQHVGDESLVFVRESVAGAKEARFRARRVTLGRSGAGLVEIKTGLQAGELIAISGTFTLRSEMLHASLTEEE